MRGQGGQKGFTLLEALIFSAIFAMVLSGVYLVYVTNQSTFVQGQSKADLQQNARVALDRMTREMRMAGYDPSTAIPAQASQTAVQVANANAVTYIGDVTGDQVSEQVTYRLQGNQIFRDISSWTGALPWPAPTSSELADNVTALSFTYYDANDQKIFPPPPLTGNLANIRRITVQVTTQGTAGTGGQQTFPVTVDVRLRNLR